MPLDRREFLIRGGQLVAGASIATWGRVGSGAEGRPGFKIGACEWSLRRGDPSSLEVAKEIGLDGVQVNLGTVGNGMHLRRPEVQRAYIDLSKRLGVEIASLAIAELNRVGLATEPRAAVWLVDSVDVARALGVEVILLAFFGSAELRADDAEGVRRLVDVLKEVAPRAEKAGVVLGLENYLSAEDNIRILDQVGSPAVQVYYDVGNSTDKGYDILKEIRLLGGKRICELHAKDAGHLLGQGRIDFQKVREAVDEAGFRGWIQIEGAAPNGLVSDYRRNLEYLRGLFPRQIS